MNRIVLRPRHFIVLLCVLAAAWLVSVLLGYFSTASESSAAMEYLKAEYSKIKPLSGTTLIADGVSRKERTIEAAYHYATYLPFANIRSHYDGELTRLGWTFLRESTFPFAHDVDYCKGNYGARLTYDLTGRYNWKYTLYLSWAEYGCSP